MEEFVNPYKLKDDVSGSICAVVGCISPKATKSKGNGKRKVKLYCRMHLNSLKRFRQFARVQ